MPKRLSKHKKWLIVILFFLVCCFVIPGLLFASIHFGCYTEQNNYQNDSSNTELLTQAYARSGDLTYLTFPEWYIVYSAQEYGAHLEHNPPSQFPYFRSVTDYWQSYCDVYAVNRQYHKFNPGYQFLLMVIGTSHSVENTIKGVYEKSIGWLFETENFTPVPEEMYAQKIAYDYGQFLQTVPWYEFDYISALYGLWTETPLFGLNMRRKIERKIILSNEYAIKALYAAIIKFGTGTAYEAADLHIHVLLQINDTALIADYPELEIIQELPDNQLIIKIPRYEPFTRLLPQLINHGAEILEIAGNTTIFTTVQTSRDNTNAIENGTLIFSQSLLTQPNMMRLGITVPVHELDSFIKNLAPNSIQLEHLYDY